MPAAVKDNVIRFNERFVQRREQFRYLSGFKELHEGLHNLQLAREAISQAVERFKQNPAHSLEIVNIGDDLREDYESAVKSSTSLGDPADTDWVEAFGRAVTSLKDAVTKKDLDALSGIVEALRTLPNQQAGLSSDLVRRARRLKPVELVTLMDTILRLLADSVPLPDAPDGAGRCLQVGPRQAALARFATRDELRSALTLNDRPAADPLQRLLDGFILGPAPQVDALDEDGLKLVSQVVGWLTGVPSREPLDLPDLDDIRRRLEFQRLVNPLRRMAGDHFHGRAEELAQVRNHLDGPPGPPMVIWGLGGVGKSALAPRPEDPRAGFRPGVPTNTRQGSLTAPTRARNNLAWTERPGWPGNDAFPRT
ncbi:MAG: hypothetical protein ACHRXM_30660 [Isosphaerales bacterium]